MWISPLFGAQEGEGHSERFTDVWSFARIHRVELDFGMTNFSQILDIQNSPRGDRIFAFALDENPLANKRDRGGLL
jgi:hypothetical protein